MAATNKKVTSVHIPDDLALSILSKLPLKSLKRFTSACKSWSLLLENPHFMDMFRRDFISKHHSVYDDTCLLLHQSTRRVPFHDMLYMLSGERFEDRVKLDWPPLLQEDASYIRILGSCSVNGTLCLYDGFDFDTTTVLWNPATGEFKVIPPSRQPYENCEYNFSPQGFGYDRVQDDYKVIRPVQYPLDFEGNWVYVPHKDSTFWEMDVNELDIDDPFWMFHVVEMYDPFWEIYSLRSNSWRKLEGVDMPYPLPFSSVVNLNDVSHWLWIRSEMESFDFSNEMFFTTTLPSLDMICKLVDKNLVVLNGSVAFIGGSDYDGTTYFHIWILGELGFKESWTKLFVVGPLTCVMHPIGTGKKGDIFFRKKDDELAWLDLSTQRIEDVGVERDLLCWKIVIYKENFISIGGMNN